MTNMINVTTGSGGASIENLSYIDYKDDLCKIENVYYGSKTASNYLQPFTKELEDSIIQRLENLTLLNFTRRAIQTSKNMLFRKELEVYQNDNQVELEDATNDVLQDTIKELTALVLRDGCAYIVVDSPQASEKVTTRADEIEQDITPSMYAVERKRVPNWTYNDDGYYRHVTVNEYYTEIKGFIEETKEQQRVFYEDRVEVWRGNEVYETIPTNIGYTPVVKVGKDDLMFLDLCKMNLRHMNRSSHLDRYLTIAAVPIPVFYGVEQKSTIIVGVDTAFNFRDKTQGGFEFVEMSGSSTTLLQEDLAKLELNMSTFIAALSQPNDVAKNETQVSAETFESDSFLTTVANQIELGVNEALMMLADQGGENLTIELNKDFNSTVITPAQISQYLSLFQNGVISHQTLLELLIVGEVLPSDLDVNVEQGMVLAETEESPDEEGQ